jgi:hypothetical protein
MKVRFMTSLVLPQTGTIRIDGADSSESPTEATIRWPIRLVVEGGPISAGAFFAWKLFRLKSGVMKVSWDYDDEEEVDRGNKTIKNQEGTTVYVSHSMEHPIEYYRLALLADILLTGPPITGVPIFGGGGKNCLLPFHSSAV